MKAPGFLPKGLWILCIEGEGKYRFTPDSKLVIEGWPDVRRDPFGAAKKLLQALA